MGAAKILIEVGEHQVWYSGPISTSAYPETWHQSLDQLLPRSLIEHIALPRLLIEHIALPRLLIEHIALD